MSGQLWSNSGNSCPIRAKVGRPWAKFGRFRAEIGPDLADVASNKVDSVPTLVGSGATSVEFGRILAKFGRYWVETGRNLSEIERHRPKVDRFRAILSDVRRICYDFGQLWPEISRCWSRFDQLRPCLGACVPIIFAAFVPERLWRNEAYAKAMSNAGSERYGPNRGDTKHATRLSQNCYGNPATRKSHTCARARAPASPPSRRPSA